jgi:anaerobic selenocysteine-containing dehydrogenase
MATTTVLGTCHHDCPDSCGWVATVDDGVVVKLRGNPEHPYSRGELCPKVNRFVDRLYSADRVLHPLIRTGAKGEGEFRRAGWDEALALIAERTHAAIDAHGGETVLPQWSAGNQSLLSLGGLSTRFFDRIGATVPTGSICGSVAKAGVAATYGSGVGMDPMDVRFSKMILLWGTNTRLTNRHLWPFVEEARAAGATVVVIDPLRTITADSADWFVQPLPGTDAALALAMMHVLIRDGLIDRDYIDSHTTGFAALEAHVRDWTPDRAAAACGLDRDEIERLATAYGTTRPAAIRTLIGAEHRQNGGMLFRTMACLPLLTGAWRERGGGLCRSVGTLFDAAVDEGALAGPSLAPAGRPLPRRVNSTQLGRTLTDTSLAPPVHVLFAWNGNPLVSLPNTELIRAGLERDDLFTVVHEQFLTDTARYADVVLPATTQLEQRDVVPAWGHLYLGWNERAVEPLGEAVSNTELFRRLATAMGFTEPELHQSDDELLASALHLSDDDLAALRGDGFVRLDLPEDFRPYAQGGFATPDGRAWLAYEGPSPTGLPALPDYEPVPEGPTDATDGRLVLLSGKMHTRFLNSSYSHLPKHGPAEGPPRLDIHPDDAAQRGIVDGDVVEVRNDRGALVLEARLSKVVRPGVVCAPFGWWTQHHRNGAVANSLTNDELSDIGGGVAYLDTLVTVGRTAG